MKILILGASGMLGNAAMRFFFADSRYEVFGSTRTEAANKYFSPELASRLIAGVDAENPDSVVRLLSHMRPDVVVNCVGLVKQLAVADDPLYALPINAILPHRLSRLCALVGARLIHISTDCVFSGRKGLYREADEPDALDLYGRSKLLGEVDYPHAVTLRTSIIGHELSSAHGLVGWFLAQKGNIKGYTQAVFSGLPTCELAQVIADFVLPHPELHGLYHVAAKPISKFELLDLVNQEYGSGIVIEPDDRLKIDRSLDSQRFHAATGYVAPSWPQLISQMRAFQQGA
jgi:dTDP-4-dehydrorhamnose reductase